MTINDVAKEAGVSITTVSRALNGNYPVKAETMEKIQAAIKKLNYKPNIMARSMITRKSLTVGVLTPGLTNLFFPAIIEAIERVLGESGYKLTVCNTNGDPETERAVVEDFHGRRLDGMIALDPSQENLENGFFYEQSKEWPLIVSNGSRKGYKGNFICYDEEKGTGEAMEALYRLGHRRIALLRGERSLSYGLREKIYRERLSAWGLPYDRVLTLSRGNSQDVVENTKRAVKELLGGPVEERPTAIFACNDLMGLAALSGAQEMGIKVSEELSIVGFDNTLFSVVTTPQLATVDLKMAEIGQRTAKGILELIEGKAIANKEVTHKEAVLKATAQKGKKIQENIHTEFLLRGSCGKAPGMENEPEKG